MCNIFPLKIIIKYNNKPTVWGVVLLLRFLAPVDAALHVHDAAPPPSLLSHFNIVSHSAAYVVREEARGLECRRDV